MIIWTVNAHTLNIYVDCFLVQEDTDFMRYRRPRESNRIQGAQRGHVGLLPDPQKRCHDAHSRTQRRSRGIWVYTRPDITDQIDWA